MRHKKGRKEESDEISSVLSDFREGRKKKRKGTGVFAAYLRAGRHHRGGKKSFPGKRKGRKRISSAQFD